MPLRILAALLIAAGPVAAHDLWLIPPEKVDHKGPVKILAASGMAFPESEHAPDAAKFGARRVYNPAGKKSDAMVGAAEEKYGVLSFAPTGDGVYIVAVETTPKFIELDAEKFNAYLVSDGLSHIYALRAKEKSLDQPGKERYSKSPKALVRVGDGEAGDPCRAVGLPLEIVPVQSPFDRKVGDTLKVNVLFRGKPLAEANLGWAHPGDGESPAGTVRTNTKGEALIPIAKAGLIAIRLTHMTRPKDKDFEWESFWTTLTFRIPD